MTRPQAGLLDALPTVLGVIGGIVILQLLFRPADPAPETADERAEGRRRFIRYAAGGAGLAMVSGGLSRLLPTSAAAEESVSAASQAAATASVQKMPPLPAGAQLDLPGITPFVTANQDFYRIDTAFIVPKLDATNWQLHIHGMVDKEITIGYDELIARPLLERMVTLTCVSNEVGGDLAGQRRLAGPADPGPAQRSGTAGRRGHGDVALVRRILRRAPRCRCSSTRTATRSSPSR